MNNLLIISLAMLIYVPSVLSDDNNSEKSQDKAKIQSTQLEAFSLSAQIPSASNYQIRARKIIVPAGAKIAKHAHDTRPGIVYVESGEIVEFRGNNSRTLTAGDSLVEDATTIHSYINKSKQDCVLIAFDIPKQGI